MKKKNVSFFKLGLQVRNSLNKQNILLIYEKKKLKKKVRLRKTKQWKDSLRFAGLVTSGVTHSIIPTIKRNS